MSIRIRPTTGGYVAAVITVTLPSCPGVRRKETKLHINITEDRTVNIPATGDLDPVSDLPVLTHALEYARSIAMGSLVVDGINLDPRKGDEPFEPVDQITAEDLLADGLVEARRPER